MVEVVGWAITGGLQELEETLPRFGFTSLTVGQRVPPWKTQGNGLQGRHPRKTKQLSDQSLALKWTEIQRAFGTTWRGKTTSSFLLFLENLRALSLAVCP
jgi:hypothetical protein